MSGRKRFIVNGVSVLKFKKVFVYLCRLAEFWYFVTVLHKIPTMPNVAELRPLRMKVQNSFCYFSASWRFNSLHFNLEELLFKNLQVMYKFCQTTARYDFFLLLSVKRASTIFFCTGVKRTEKLCYCWWNLERQIW